MAGSVKEVRAVCCASLCCVLRGQDSVFMYGTMKPLKKSKMDPQRSIDASAAVVPRKARHKGYSCRTPGKAIVEGASTFFFQM